MPTSDRLPSDAATVTGPYHGVAHEAVLARVVGGLHVVEWRHPPGAHYPWVGSDDPTLAVVLTGAFLERVLGQRRGVRAAREFAVDAF